MADWDFGTWLILALALGLPVLALRLAGRTNWALYRAGVRLCVTVWYAGIAGFLWTSASCTTLEGGAIDCVLLSPDQAGTIVAGATLATVLALSLWLALSAIMIVKRAAEKRI